MKNLIFVLSIALLSFVFASCEEDGECHEICYITHTDGSRTYAPDYIPCGEDAFDFCLEAELEVGEMCDCEIQFF